jgi:hypothetical protein
MKVSQKLSLFVFLSFQRAEIFIIKKVFAGIPPALFILNDLLGETLKAKFYQKQLQLAPDPLKVGFDVEKIVGHRSTKENGKEVKVRYLFYGPKFDRWVKADNFVKGVKHLMD